MDSGGGGGGEGGGGGGPGGGGGGPSKNSASMPAGNADENHAHHSTLNNSCLSWRRVVLTDLRVALPTRRQKLSCLGAWLGLQVGDALSKSLDRLARALCLTMARKSDTIY